jgi:hypothetical protein
MRAIDCPCGHTVEAPDDEALFRAAREHIPRGREPLLPVRPEPVKGDRILGVRTAHVLHALDCQPESLRNAAGIEPR